MCFFLGHLDPEQEQPEGAGCGAFDFPGVAGVPSEAYHVQLLAEVSECELSGSGVAQQPTANLFMNCEHLLCYRASKKHSIEGACGGLHGALPCRTLLALYQCDACYRGAQVLRQGQPRVLTGAALIECCKLYPNPTH